MPVIDEIAAPQGAVDTLGLIDTKMPMTHTPLLMHLARALRAVVGRELHKFLRQPSRLASSLVRPLLWFVVFSAGFHNVFGGTVMAPYNRHVEYQEYMLPGLLGMIALFNGMQSSLGMVYDREMGVMRLLLTAPLPRGWLLGFKLAGSTALSLLQMLVFLAVAWAFGVTPTWGWLAAVPAMILGATMLAALGLALSVHIRQLENFAGTMNFVIFPLFFISSALHPLSRFQEAGAAWLYALGQINPFTSAVELMRYALQGQFHASAALAVGLTAVVSFALALRGYDPQRGWVRQRA
jgi:ABC-2 type transport system permease protein